MESFDLKAKLYIKYFSLCIANIWLKKHLNTYVESDDGVCTFNIRILRVKYVYPQALPITKNIIIESNKHFTTFAHCHKIYTIRQDGVFAINIHSSSLFHDCKLFFKTLPRISQHILPRPSSNTQKMLCWILVCMNT